MRRIGFIISLLICGLLAGVARGETFKLASGESLVGEALVASANDQGIQIKVGEGEYKRVAWAEFSQEDLKNFAKNQKLEQFVEPFIEITPEDRIKKTEVNLKQPQRLERPPRQSLAGAMFSSGLGLVIVLLLYAANVYAGYEVAIFRAQSVPLVCGVSAALPLIGPIIFLSMPTKVQPMEETWEPPPEAAAAAQAEVVNPMLAAGAEHPAALKLHTDQPEQAAAPGLPETQIFKRGQFTFNRRFIETKFPGFFGVVRRDADRDMVMVVKSSRGDYIGQRITRIAANDLHLQVQKGHASEEVMIPFVEIQEIQLKHKDK